MPAKFDRCVKAVRGKSRGRVNAYAVCTAAGTRANPVDYSKYKLNDPAQRTLQMGVERGGMDPDEIMDIAHVIAKIDDQQVHARHIAEAEQYIHGGMSEGESGWDNLNKLAKWDQSEKDKHGRSTMEAIISKRAEKITAKRNPRKRSNPESAASSMYESFHGSPSEEVIEFHDQEHYHGNLAGLGVLVELKLCTITGYDVTLSFSDPEALVAANPGVWERLKGIGSRSTVYSVPKHVEKMVKAGSVKGHEIFKAAKGDFRVPTLERESSFDSLADAKRFIGEWVKANGKNPGPFQSASKVIGSTGKYLDNQLGKILKKGKNPGTSQDPALLCSNEAGTQLYIQGGNQSVDLKSIHMDEVTQKDSMVLGECYFVSYFTTKDFDNHAPTIYEHSLAEESDKKQKYLGQGSGLYPILRYDTLNEKLYLDGGNYFIKKPMFSTSPGIQD